MEGGGGAVTDGPVTTSVEILVHCLWLWSYVKMYRRKVVSDW